MKNKNLTPEKMKPAPPAGDTIERELKNQASLPPVPPELFLAVVSNSEPLVTAAELEKIQVLQDQWKNCHRTIYDHTADKAKRRFFEDQKIAGENISAGHAPAEDAWSLEDYLEDGASRMAASKRRALAITLSACAICRPIVMRFILSAHALADRLEASEKEVYAEYGLPYTPSSLISAIRNSARIAAFRVSSGPNWSTPPAYILQFLNLT
jgi:hypothetical protein